MKSTPKFDPVQWIEEMKKEHNLDKDYFLRTNDNEIKDDFTELGLNEEKLALVLNEVKRIREKQQKIDFSIPILSKLTDEGFYQPQAIELGQPVTIHVIDATETCDTELIDDLHGYVTKHTNKRDGTQHIFCTSDTLQQALDMLKEVKEVKLRLTGHWQPKGMSSFSGFKANQLEKKRQMAEIGQQIAAIVNRNQHIKKVILSGCVTADFLQKDLDKMKTSGFAKIKFLAKPIATKQDLKANELVLTSNRDGIITGTWLEGSELKSKPLLPDQSQSILEKIKPGQTSKDPALIKDLVSKFSCGIDVKETPEEQKKMRKLVLFGEKYKLDKLALKGLLGAVIEHVDRPGVEIVGHPTPISYSPEGYVKLEKRATITGQENVTGALIKTIKVIKK